MKKYLKLCILFFTLVVASGVYASVAVCSWNLHDFGKSKTDQSIEFIANTVKQYDIIAVQEVVVGPGGAQAVARLQDALNRKGAAWDYTISAPTTSFEHGSERYAFLWKKSKVKLVGKAWLEQKYNREIDREPYMATFRVNRKEFTLVNFHAVPTSKHPATEIPYLSFIPSEYPKLNLVFCGDFNIPESKACFNPLKSLGYQPAFTKQKTSLKNKCINEDCLASEYDNFFLIPGKTAIVQKNVILFFKCFPDITSAKHVSDHIPVIIIFDVK